MVENFPENPEELLQRHRSLHPHIRGNDRSFIDTQILDVIKGSPISQRSRFIETYLREMLDGCNINIDDIILRKKKIITHVEVSHTFSYISLTYIGLFETFLIGLYWII